VACYQESMDYAKGDYLPRFSPFSMLRNFYVEVIP
jgi:hypothetical protein